MKNLCTSVQRLWLCTHQLVHAGAISHKLTHSKVSYQATKSRASIHYLVINEKHLKQPLPGIDKWCSCDLSSAFAQDWHMNMDTIMNICHLIGTFNWGGHTQSYRFAAEPAFHNDEPSSDTQAVAD